MTSSKKHRRNGSDSSLALHSLSLPHSVLNALRKRGIYCVPSVSVEHQHLAKRYVLRGVESGGAVSDMGRTCVFVGLDGSPLHCFQSLQSLAVNGRHAIFLAESFVRLEMLRSLKSYELVITRHALSPIEPNRRPHVVSTLMFHGKDGVLARDLWTEKHRRVRGEVAPMFYDRGGEVVQLPHKYEDAIRALTTAVCCIGCKHTHLGMPPLAKE